MLLKLKPTTVTRWLVVIAVVLLVAHIIVVLVAHANQELVNAKSVLMFNLGFEQNLPTLFATVLLLIATGLIWMCRNLNRQRGQATGAWTGLIVIFSLLVLDEFASLHEMLIIPMRTLFNTSGLLHYAWVIPYGLLVVVLGGMYLPFIRRLPLKIRNLTILAGALYCGGALGFEFLEGLHADRPNWSADIWWESMIIFEECMEMAGMILFIHALMRYLSEDFDSAGLKFESSWDFG